MLLRSLRHVLHLGKLPYATPTCRIYFTSCSMCGQLKRSLSYARVIGLPRWLKVLARDVHVRPSSSLPLKRFLNKPPLKESISNKHL